MTDTGNTPASTSVIARVKWFNNKAGYGFTTVVLPDDSEHVGKDIFSHHSGIKVSDEQYRYLVQGEYVALDVERTESGEHELHATNITGVGGGKLMCETRNDARLARQDDGEEQGTNTRRQPRNNRGDGQRVRLRGGGVREGEIWTLVKEDRRPARNSKRPNRGDDLTT